MRVFGFILTVCCLSIFLFKQALAQDNILRERIFLQTDKQLYLAGELMWIKLVATDAKGKPLNLSKIAYVELLNDVEPILQAKVELSNGVGVGRLAIPTAVPSASYRLVAYSHYMLNEGEQVFFSKEVPILNTLLPQTVELSSLAGQSPIAVERDTSSKKTSFYTAEDRMPLSLNVDKHSYPTRSTGKVELNGIPKDVHTLSVSIYGYDSLPSTLSSNLLEWKHGMLAKHAEGIEFTDSYMPEYEGHIITGKIIDSATGEQAKSPYVTPILSFPGKEVRLFVGQTDSSGNVAFYTKRIDGVEDVVVKTITYEGARRYKIELESPFFHHSSKPLPPLTINTSRNEKLLERSIGLQALNIYLGDSLSVFSSKHALFRQKPSKSYLLDEYTRFTTMKEIFIEFIREARFRRADKKTFLSVLMGDDERAVFSRAGSSLVLLDGVPVSDHHTIYTYDPLLVERIDIYSNKYCFANQMFDGIIFLSTYNHNYPKLKLDEDAQLFSYKGTQPYYRFYAPLYNTEEQKRARTPDYRHTLLWEPNVEVDGKTSTAIIPFTTSDITGDFMVKVEGITKDGQVILEERLIKVEDQVSTAW